MFERSLFLRLVLTRCKTLCSPTKTHAGVVGSSCERVNWTNTVGDLGEKQISEEKNKRTFPFFNLSDLFQHFVFRTYSPCYHYFVWWCSVEALHTVFLLRLLVLFWKAWFKNVVSNSVQKRFSVSAEEAKNRLPPTVITSLWTFFCLASLF